MEEKVNHPKHYNSLPAVCDKCGDTIECIEVVRHFNFNLGNVIKYIWRAAHKGNPLEDLKKALWYLQDEIAFFEKEMIERKESDYTQEAKEKIISKGLMPFKRAEE